LKRSTNPAEKGGRPKDIFEMASIDIFGHIRASFLTRPSLSYKDQLKKYQPFANQWRIGYGGIDVSCRSQITDFHTTKIVEEKYETLL
jgi:hypothetical protein